MELLNKKKFLEIYNKKAGSISAIAKELGIAEKAVEDMEWSWAIYPEQIEQMKQENNSDLPALIRSFKRHIKNFITKYRENIDVEETYDILKQLNSTDFSGNLIISSKKQAELENFIEPKEVREKLRKELEDKEKEGTMPETEKELRQKLDAALKDSFDLFTQAQDIDKKLHTERVYAQNLEDKVKEQERAVQDLSQIIANLQDKMKGMVPIPPKPATTGKFTRNNVVIPQIFPQVLTLAKQRMSILLVGPTGCGKTTVAELIAENLKLPFRAISVSRGITEGTLGGRLLPSKGGVFKYAISEFVLTYEKGGVILLDELDAGDDNTLIYINNALGGNRCSVPNRLEKPFALRHKDFVCIGAANTYGNGADRMYVGRNQLDNATLDRFCAGSLFMDYDPTVEEKIVREDILAWGRTLRERIRALSLRRSLSTRFLKDITIMANNAPEFYGRQEDWFNTLTQSWSKDEIARVQR